MTLAAPYASDPLKSRGRQHVAQGGETRGPRDDFQRDRDRIIHSIAFRRLRHKTQVFVAPDGDHFRVRLTHSLEVAQIGRTIARALGLNEDLTDALCLAHDIGHPPFGHAGEDALEAAMASAGGFDHNAQTLRTLVTLEQSYPGHDGLNLTWETLEGLAKHNGPVTHVPWALAEIDAAFPLQLGSWPSLEAQVAAVADDIAYDNHDIDDGIRAGLLTLDDVAEVPLVFESLARVRARYPDLPAERLARELVREQIGRMVMDVIDETRRRLAEARPQSADDVRAAGRQLASFSAGMAAQEKALKTFMYARLYRHPFQLDMAEHACKIVAGLANFYQERPELLPESWRLTLPEAAPRRMRHIGDFIAGMTDRFALARYEELIGPADMPNSF